MTFDHDIPVTVTQFGAHITCEHPASTVRLDFDTWQRPRYRRQCNTCGDLHGPMIGKAALEARGELAAVTPVDQDLITYAEGYRRALGENAERQQRETWEQWYATYIQSDAWRHKRELVLQRDDYTCQGCLERPATQVHHLTYDHAGDEFLWELVAVCDHCHDREHPEET